MHLVNKKLIMIFRVFTHMLFTFGNNARRLNAKGSRDRMGRGSASMTPREPQVRVWRRDNWEPAAGPPPF